MKWKDIWELNRCGHLPAVKIETVPVIMKSVIMTVGGVISRDKMMIKIVIKIREVG